MANAAYRHRRAESAHAGEGGQLGGEEGKPIIAPAIAQLVRDEGIDITGPIAADALVRPAHPQPI